MADFSYTRRLSMPVTVFGMARGEPKFLFQTDTSSHRSSRRNPSLSRCGKRASSLILEVSFPPATNRAKLWKPPLRTLVKPGIH